MISVQEEFCPKNHICPVIRLCPVGAIRQNGPYSAPVIDMEKCIDCGKCSKACRTFKQIEAA